MAAPRGAQHANFGVEPRSYQLGRVVNTRSVSIDPVSDKRFELLRPLGEGASGAVFLALDHETGEQVALKKLFKLDQKSVQRFKREFRLLADISHPNLVRLYDLQRGQDAWFLTMEYVAGKDFRQTLADHAKAAQSRSAVANDVSTDNALLPLFFDLACGVHAIHRAGMLHRDLKPSNVLVSDSGRVVVLDFGLVRDIAGENQLTQEGLVSGTPAYMPPEQAMGGTLTPAADWYAFGVMLYEAISGVLPIDGRNALKLLRRKLREDPLPLSTGAPREVLDLCMGLLAREPEQRPSGAKVLEALAAVSGQTRELTLTQEQHPLTMEPQALNAAQRLFGREAELASLHAALPESSSTRSVVVHVRGASGSGKSTLLEHFIEEADASAVVLRGRCYERESMPFKALDGVVDALVAHLSKLDDVTCAHLLPVDIADLARLFPVFERLGTLERLRVPRAVRGKDDTQTRRRGEQALRTLLTNLAQDHRVLLWIDDLQWGDLDSAAVLRDWLERPLEAPVLIALSYRSEEIATSSALAILLAQPEQTTQAAQQTIDLEPLRADDVRTLCLHRLTRQSLAPGPMIERIVQESRGNPFLAQQLTALAQAKLARGDTSLDGLTMEALVQGASAYLDEPARALLNVLAVAGRPLNPQLALTAAGVFSAGRAHIHTLRSLRLVRTRDVAGERSLEVYHDRVREVMQASLTPEQSRHVHAARLQRLTIGGHAEHDWLHTLALGAGQQRQAFQHGWLAAERASESLAFERAAELYRSCLQLHDGEQELYVLWMKLAAAQAHCRRGYEAAQAYASAAEHAPAAQRGTLLQLAASHLVRSGHFEKGERVMQQVLAAEKMHVPKTTAGMLAAIGWEHARIALRRFDVPVRAAADTDDLNEQRGLLYGTLSLETQTYAPLRSALFQARSLRLCLDYGQPYSVARALCLAATIAAVSGTQRAARRSQQLLVRAEQLFERAGRKEPPLELLSARAVCAQFVGGLEQALDPALEVERSIAAKRSSDPHGDYYYMFAVQMVRISALQAMGRMLEGREALHEHMTLARATDNRAAILQVTMNRVIDEQALDLCRGSRAARRRVRAAAEEQLQRADCCPHAGCHASCLRDQRLRLGNVAVGRAVVALPAFDRAPQRVPRGVRTRVACQVAAQPTRRDRQEPGRSQSARAKRPRATGPPTRLVHAPRRDRAHRSPPGIPARPARARRRAVARPAADRHQHALGIRPRPLRPRPTRGRRRGHAAHRCSADNAERLRHRRSPRVHAQLRARAHALVSKNSSG
jgi:eukaryotic-like serine/threonine-protein kinase